ncbi:MAG TPA: MBL fold metallo-hydrolase [Candidatus Babeliales bacterium]|nr:MBL fold metallo-hydrolase [Candidatus Babeliales bacterium]
MLKSVKILSDNYVCELFNCLAEHGFSAYIETTEGRYLFDTGRGDVVIKNAKSLDVDLTKLDAIIISHGHYDHTGGLELVLSITGPIDVFGHPAIFDKKWLIKKDFKKEIGIPVTKERLENLGARLHLSKEPTQVSEDTWITGQIPRVSDCECIDRELFIEQNDKLVFDELLDDQAMYVIDPDGINIILGCTHSGIESTLKHIINKTGIQDIKMLIGGFHLFKSNQQAITEAIETLCKYKIAKLAVSHCTGLEAAIEIQKVFKNKFEIAAVGSSF